MKMKFQKTYLIGQKDLQQRKQKQTQIQSIALWPICCSIDLVRRFQHLRKKRSYPQLHCQLNPIQRFLQTHLGDHQKTIQMCKKWHCSLHCNNSMSGNQWTAQRQLGSLLL
ncbi:hypothetical protein GUJ93_ZPchr0001g29752 [Zizania palustris]|uniref:Uncharacterized protein n=1 Tax=Zizania palustris TaxID=103762 RepID=A0A8J5RZM4_ZIZPA|nr:hypothetical protein GUJ93_ZPchr0001g29752 [Zizania palustris]